MKNNRRSYLYINSEGMFEIWSTIPELWFIGTDERGYKTKRECKKELEKRYGKVYTFYEWKNLHRTQKCDSI